MTKYWISLRAVRGDNFTDDIDLGATRYLKVPDGETPMPHHAIGVSQWIKDLIASFPLQPSPVDRSPVATGDVVFFAHGYNTTVATIDAAQNELSRGLSDNDFRCQVVAFDWPSGDSAFAYLRDLDHARTTAIRLVKAGIKPFLAALAKNCNVRVHAIGHSMGCFVLREAFDHADDGAAASSNWAVGQLVMFAGDVDAPSFAEGDADTESMYRHCYRFTNYFNRYDEILQISNAKRFGVEPRVGRVGLPDTAPSSSCNVDCSAWFDTTYGAQAGTLEYPGLTHSWYFTDRLFLRDLSYALAGKIDRQKIPTRGPGPGQTQILNGGPAQVMLASG
ncbi:alpha/beta hydrolase [Methylovirgula sp. 4M-Z18]|uniref:alpha/beta hydrolase n=1 Tax=Methylovirgula sp. 4M-Z18 TaxID=2293567 RepID=UPI0013141039|nr:alpha/beta hydrolase [Methylovirgula sp. 4M-Z18]